MAESIIDERKRMSESLLWKLQNAAYTEFGPEAWRSKGVPFYLTSNPFTASRYAHLVLGFLRDCLASEGAMRLDVTQPIYIFDLGAGTGCFGYLFLKNLKAILAELQMEKLKIRYVMTDIVPENIELWQQHPRLQEFIQEGWLDFTFYRHDDRDFPLKLIRTEEALFGGKVANPIVVIGNYFFDTIPQDLFRIKDGKLEEGRTTLLVRQEIEINKASAVKPEWIRNLECRFDYVPIANPESYYPDPDLNDILKLYVKKFENVPFMFPVGAFQSIRYFRDLSKGRLLLVAGDQAVCTEEQIKKWGEPQISRHGSFSFSVSYHAIALYFQCLGGMGLLTSMPEPLFAVVAAVLGAGPEKLPETRLAFSDFLDSFEPKDYWNLATTILENWSSPPLEYLILLLKLGNWDPKNFYAFYDVIRNQIPQADEETKGRLLKVISNVWEQFYPISKAEGDFVMNLGVLCYEMKAYRDALFYFQKAIEISGENSRNIMNLSACYISLGDKENAKRYLDKAKQLKNDEG